MRACALALSLADRHQRAQLRTSQTLCCIRNTDADGGRTGKLASTVVSASPPTLQLDAWCGPPVAPHRAPHLQHVFDSLTEAFAAERAAGFTIGSHQPPQSVARLDAAVRAAVQAYVAAGHQVSRQQ